MTRPEARSRRRLLAALGAGTAAGFAGCLGDGIGVNGEPSYEEGGVVDVDGEGRDAASMAAAEDLAEREVTDGVTPLSDLEVVDHAFVLEDDYRGSTVQGTVENAGDERVELVEVRVRVFDDAGDQLGRYLDNTGDLEGGAAWAFQVVVLESPADVAEYDLTVLGTPT